MTEQIYIDGVLIELDSSRVNVQLIYQSPVLVDFQQIVSNRTTQVTLPMTSRNMVAIGYTGTQVESDYAYQKHRVVYKRDGVQLLKGIATLLGIKKDGIAMCFTWGNAEALAALFETKLRDIRNINTFDLEYVQYPPEDMLQSEYKNKLNFGGGRKGVSIKLLPYLVSMQEQLSLYGLTDLAFLTGDNESGVGLSLALPTRNGDLYTREQQAVRISSLKTRIWEVSTNFWLTTLLLNSGTDPHEYMNEYGIIDVTEQEVIRFDLEGTFEKDQYATFPVGETDMKIIFDRGNGWDYDGGILVATGTVVSGSVYRYTFDFHQDIDVSDVERIAIAITADISSNPVTLQNESLAEFVITPTPDEPEEVIYGTGLSVYPVHLNLPDMTCGQLIKNLLWLRGEFAYSRDGKTFERYGFNDIVAKKAQAVDWTKKMNGRITEWASTLEGTAQFNYFRYEEADHYDNTMYQGILQTEDQTIQEETEYCKSDFALAPGNQLPVWTQNEDGEWTFEGDNSPAVLIASDVEGGLWTRAGFMDAQRWENLLAVHYPEYARMIRKPVVVKANVVLTTYDLFTLDLTVPVYLQQTGHYYLIRKLSVKGSADCEVELIKI